MWQALLMPKSKLTAREKSRQERERAKSLEDRSRQLMRKRLNSNKRSSSAISAKPLRKSRNKLAMASRTVLTAEIVRPDFFAAAAFRSRNASEKQQITVLCVCWASWFFRQWSPLRGMGLLLPSQTRSV